MYIFWQQRREDFESNTLYFWGQVKPAHINFHTKQCQFSSVQPGFRALDNYSRPIKGRVKQKANFLQSESAGILLKIRGVNDEVEVSVHVRW